MATTKKLPKAPAHDIHWGIVTEDCKAKMIEWIKNSIKVMRILTYQLKKLQKKYMKKSYL